MEQIEAVNRQPEELLRSKQQVPMQQEVYADIVKNMQFGLNVWRLEDPNDITSFRLVATNSAATKLTGVSLEDKLGRRIIECFPNLRKENRRDLERYAAVATSGQGMEQPEMYYADEHLPGSFFSVKVFSLPNQATAGDR